MTTQNPQQHTAKIYRFPIGGRASVGPRRIDTKPSNLRVAQYTPTVAGEGWYHDAAIQEAKRPYEH